MIPKNGPSVEAFTTDPIQVGLGSGTALINGKKGGGMSIDRGNFTITNPDLNQAGVQYFWTASGD